MTTARSQDAAWDVHGEGGGSHDPHTAGWERCPVQPVAFSGMGDLLGLKGVEMEGRSRGGLEIYWG